jgi:hypothetical protein
MRAARGVAPEVIERHKGSYSLFVRLRDLKLTAFGTSENRKYLE